MPRHFNWFLVVPSEKLVDRQTPMTSTKNVVKTRPAGVNSERSNFLLWARPLSAELACVLLSARAVIAHRCYQAASFCAQLDQPCFCQTTAFPMTFCMVIDACLKIEEIIPFGGADAAGRGGGALPGAEARRRLHATLTRTFLTPRPTRRLSAHFGRAGARFSAASANSSIRPLRRHARLAITA